MTRTPLSKCLALLAIALLALASGSALADSADAGRVVVVSDDIHKRMANVQHATDDDSGSGTGNNGYGNNADGVDSSNPGQGDGGPNGGADPSGDVDDEAGGGGAAPSKGKGKK